MKENWKKGVFDFIYKREKRICVRENCGNKFEVTKSDPKMYCSHRCSAIVSNGKRGPMSTEQKLKISKTLFGRKHQGFENPFKGKIKVPRVEIICANPKCFKKFLSERWMHRKFCSVPCAMAITGGKPTSPKASKGKGGIRKDVSDTIYFYSRWEANFARLMNYLKIRWEYAPKTFNLETQNYTPDFYLPEANIFIEVKNFMWKYSQQRDEKFRKLYPNIKLELLLKDDYLKLQNTYSNFIKNWEYSNSHLIKYEKTINLYFIEWRYGIREIDYRQSSAK